MTQPVFQLFQILLDEFLELNNQRRKLFYKSQDQEQPSGNIWEDLDVLAALEQEGDFINEWCSIFSQEDIEACLGKVRVVSVKEELPLDKETTLKCFSSGLHLGACFWQFRLAGDQQLAFVDGFGIHRYRYCQSFDFEALNQSQKVWFTNRFVPDQETSSKSNNTLQQFEQKINRLFQQLKKDYGLGKYLLLPFSNFIDFIDLFELIVQNKNQFSRVYVLSDQVEKMMSIVNINIDYLSDKYRGKIYHKQPSLPLSFQKEDNKTIRFF